MCLKNQKLYYIGGAVRDEILGIQSVDTDFCYEGNAIEFAENNDLRILKKNTELCTVKVSLDSGQITDIASTRTESYPQKGHLPKIEQTGCSLEMDVKRRDFTVNALAKRTTDNEFIDYFNGINDIQNKTLRVLHDNSFIDDPSRIIRGLKFSVRFGFELDEKTRVLQNTYLNNINYDMSYHRIKKELKETFELNNPVAFDRFIEEDIYKLLGEKIAKPNIKGADIKNEIEKSGLTENIWFIYAAPFIDTESANIPLTRAEKRILEWCKKLKTQEPTHNTPKESIILSRLINND